MRRSFLEEPSHNAVPEGSYRKGPPTLPCSRLCLRRRTAGLGGSEQRAGPARALNTPFCGVVGLSPHRGRYRGAVSAATRSPTPLSGAARVAEQLLQSAPGLCWLPLRLSHTPGCGGSVQTQIYRCSPGSDCWVCLGTDLPEQTQHCVRLN